MEHIRVVVGRYYRLAFDGGRRPSPWIMMVVEENGGEPHRAVFYNSVTGQVSVQYGFVLQEYDPEWLSSLGEPTVPYIHSHQVLEEISAEELAVLEQEARALIGNFFSGGPMPFIRPQDLGEVRPPYKEGADSSGVSFLPSQ